MRKAILTALTGLAVVLGLLVTAPTAGAQVTDVVVCQTSIGTSWDYSDSTPFNTPVLASDFVAGGLSLDLTGEASGGKKSGYTALTNAVLIGQIAQTDTMMSYTVESGPPPGYQLRAHPQGGDEWAGHWVYENGKWWATRPASWLLLPNPGSSGGATLAEIAAAYPQATVSHVGFSLGSGVTGKGLLTSFTFQGTRFVFGACAAETTTTTPSSTSSTSTSTSTATSTETSTASTTSAPTSSPATTTSTGTAVPPALATTTTTTRAPVFARVDNASSTPVGSLADTGPSSLWLLIAIGALVLCAGSAAVLISRLRQQRKSQS